MTSSLRAHLDAQLPRSLAAGRPSTLWLLGTAWDPDADIRHLDVEVDGVPQELDAWGMPRPDVGATAAALGREAARRATSSGLWSVVRLPAFMDVGEVELVLRASLEGGQTKRTRIARIPVTGSIVPAASAGAEVCVCLATYDPDPELLTVQVESLRAQRGVTWTCVVSDDASPPEAVERIREILGEDSRFRLSLSTERRGFYRNFERALGMVPADADYVALCDQDDRWHPDKLASLRQGLGAARLVYSDQQLTDASGAILRGSLWHGRANNHVDLTSMLVSNTVTGAASLFPRSLLDVLLPFPETPGFQFHDHWLAVVALATGDVAYVDRPLYDYVQHPGAVFGEVSSGRPERVPLHERRPGDLVLGPVRRRVTRWRAAYFHGYEVRRALALTALQRGGDMISAPKRRALERYCSVSRSPVALAWLVLRSLRTLAGRTETLASERELASGVVWRWAIGALARLGAWSGRPRGDARAPWPGDFEQRRLRAWRAATRSPATSRRG